MRGGMSCTQQTDLGDYPDHDPDPGILAEYLPLRERQTVRILWDQLRWFRFAVSS